MKQKIRNVSPVAPAPARWAREALGRYLAHCSDDEAVDLAIHVLLSSSKSRARVREKLHESAVSE